MRKKSRRNEKWQEYRGNPLAEAHRALRGEAPPIYQGISEEEMLRVIKLKKQELKDAIDRANSKLEPKPHGGFSQPGGSRIMPRPRQQPRIVRPAEVVQRPSLPPVETLEPLCSEEELAVAMAEARIAGRSTITMVELIRLLAPLPFQTSYRRA